MPKTTVYTTNSGTYKFEADRFTEEEDSIAFFDGTEERMVSYFPTKHIVAIIFDRAEPEPKAPEGRVGPGVRHPQGLLRQAAQNLDAAHVALSKLP